MRDAFDLAGVGCNLLSCLFDKTEMPPALWKHFHWVLLFCTAKASGVKIKPANF